MHIGIKNRPWGKFAPGSLKQQTRARALALLALAGILLLAATPAFAATLTPNQWTAMNEPPMGVQLLGWDEIRYAPEMEGILFYGAFRSFTSENQNAVWLYRYKENRWRLLQINLFDTRSEMDCDGGHSSGKMIYDQNRKALVYGGLVSMGRNDRARTWIFDPRALVGWDANPTATPGIAYDGASAYLPPSKKCFQYAAGAGTWLYDATADVWSKLAATGGPPGTTDVVFDPKGNRILAFGGAAGYYGGAAFTTYNDLWAFDLTAQTWSKLTTTNPPPTRGWPQMALSTASNVLMISGGFSGAMDANGNYQGRTDTWVLDLSTLAWTQLANAAAPSTSYSNHMAYDPVNDVFLMASGQTPTNLGYGYQCAMYALKYQGPQGNNVPTPPVNPVPAYDFSKLPKPTNNWTSVGTGNISAVNGWALRPSLASTGTKLLLGFSEYDPPGKYQTEGCYVYAFEYSGSSWTKLGTSVSDLNAFSQMPSACYDSTGKPVISYQSMIPWQGSAVVTKSFAGTWTSVGALTSEPGVGFSSLAGDTTLGIAWQAHPQYTKGIATYVATLGATGWMQPAAGGPLNVGDPTATRGQFPALIHDGQDRLVVAWSEQQAGYEGENATPERIHVRRLENNAWTALATDNPVASPSTRVFSFALGLYNGNPVIASCEGTDGGTAQLIVRAWNGNAWTQLGSSALNVLGSGSGALKPALVSSGTSLYVAWPEFLPNCPPLLFVKQWDGAKWTMAGGPLNSAPGTGAVHTPAMSTLNGIPVVAWSEHDFEGSTLRQIFVKMLQASGPVAFFTSVNQGAMGINVDASASSDASGTIKTYAWNFGDGTTGTGVTATHTFSKAGTFTVTLTITDDKGASATTTRQIKVNSVQPPATPTISPNGGMFNAPTPVTITCSTSGAAIYYTTDGSTPDATSVLYTGSFMLSASATVQAIALLPGAPPSDLATAQFVIGKMDTPPVLVSDISALPNPADVGQSVAFSATATDADGDPLTYQWDFGDGSTASGSNTTHTYTNVGTFTVQLTISDGQNQIGSSAQVLIQIGGNGNALPMKLSALSIKLNFATSARDEAKFSGLITLPTSLVLSGISAQVTVGNFSAPLAIKSSGKGANGTAVLTLSGKSKHNAFAAGPAKFAISIKGANIAPEVATFGLTNSTIKRPGTRLQLPLGLLLDGNTFATTATVLYSAVAGKSGNAVLLRN
jgi:PKD repeat protein